MKNKKAQIFILIFKALFHYFDCGSDLLLLYDVIQRVTDNKFSEFYQQGYLTIAFTMFLGLLGERILVYFLLLEFQSLDLENKIEK